MNRQKISTFILGSLLVAAGSLSAAEPARAEEFGDPKAGRETFMALKCTTCHRVLGDSTLPAPVAAEPAPILGGLNKEHTNEELAQAIIQPSHTAASGFKLPEDGVSRMGDMGDTMTVAQLRDIVAYLKDRETSEESVWPSEGYATARSHN